MSRKPSPPARDPRLVHVGVWVFDLDNTLYHHRYNLFAEVNDRINRFIATELGLDDDTALRLRREYYESHGTTLRGLMTRHQVDPEHFLSYVHDVDVNLVPPNAALERSLARLPGRKLVFTSGSCAYAERVMEQLGVRHHFEAVFDIVAADYVPKPDPATYDRFVATHAIAPRSAIMFEDIARNLAPAAALGMTTVWVRGADPHGHEGADDGHVDFVTDDLSRWLEETT